MHAELERAHVGTAGGRFGHSVGLQLTEWPSILPAETVELRAGMVLCIEPSAPLLTGHGASLVHEEMILVTEDGCEVLSERAPREIPIVGLGDSQSS